MNIYLIEDSEGESCWIAARIPEEAVAFYNGLDTGNEALHVTAISPATWDFQYVHSDDGSPVRTFTEIMAEPRESDEAFFIADLL